MYIDRLRDAGMPRSIAMKTSYHHQRNSPAAYPLSVVAAHPLNTFRSTGSHSKPPAVHPLSVRAAHPLTLSSAKRLSGSSAHALVLWVAHPLNVFPSHRGSRQLPSSQSEVGSRRALEPCQRHHRPRARPSPNTSRKRPRRPRRRAPTSRSSSSGRRRAGRETWLPRAL